ncbi:hypothetical protein JHK87_031382 [Glycine soja]|nr:hypothetical protein JHK87_031382 [Glycine soja]
MYWDSQDIAKYSTLVELSRVLCEFSYCEEEDYENMFDLFSEQLTRMRLKNRSIPPESAPNAETKITFDSVLDPMLVRPKGCGQSVSDELGRHKGFKLVDGVWQLGITDAHVQIFMEHPERFIPSSSRMLH